MNEQELNSILQSDMALWENASTEPSESGSITKVIDLPYGIGRTEVTLGGMDNAIGKRAALSAFGDYIRELIRDRTDDEAVEARAKQAAARAKSEDSEDSVQGSPQGVSDTASVQEAVEESGEAHEVYAPESTGLRETLTTRRLTLTEGIKEAEANLAVWRIELRAIEMALDVLGDDDE